jgi:hypothetical protein
MSDLQFDLLLSECENPCRFRKVKREWAKGVAWRRIRVQKRRAQHCEKASQGIRKEIKIGHKGVCEGSEISEEFLS